MRSIHMNWAHYAIVALQSGKSATINPRGHSMKPKVNDNDTVVVEPTGTYDVGDVVLVRVNGKVYLHLVVARRQQKNKLQFQIGNNHGGINGWVKEANIYGKAVSVNGIAL